MLEVLGFNFDEGPLTSRFLRILGFLVTIEFGTMLC
jgi:hypothetical protein